MPIMPITLVIDPDREDRRAIEFCEDFLAGHSPRFVLGRNEYAKGIATQIDIDGFIDDFTANQEFEGKPVISTAMLPKEALAVSAVVGILPITAQRSLVAQGVRELDYYAFQKYSGLNLPDVLFLGGFQRDFETNRDRYEQLYYHLVDLESKRILSHLINFRLSRNLSFMEGFVDTQYRQYFEEFLYLKRVGETFLDVGSFDGYTSQEFVKRCPEYNAIHVFEPEPTNMANVVARLQGLRNIHYHPIGASSHPQILRFKSGGSASMLDAEGDLEVKVERIDDVVLDQYSFLKMDIEGGEISALQGACKTITRYRPRLAISVYHKADDLWRIPELVLSMCDDYKLYLRHYTEGVTETVMFFIPAD